jgi:hypothetical protein
MMVLVGSEVKLSNGKRAVKYVVIGLEKPFPMFEEGGAITAILKRGRRVRRVFLEKVICL